MVVNLYAKFAYGPLRIKKALGIFGNKSGNKKNNRLSDLGPFPCPKIRHISYKVFWLNTQWRNKGLTWLHVPHRSRQL